MLYVVLWLYVVCIVLSHGCILYVHYYPVVVYMLYVQYWPVVECYIYSVALKVYTIFTILPCGVCCMPNTALPPPLLLPCR